jgi:hypothetical protein
MRIELNILGAYGAQLRYVYPRHANWTLLETNTSNDNETDGNGHLLVLWYADETHGAGLNLHQGCCVFQGKWWQGGLDQSQPSAYEVLIGIIGAPGGMGHNQSGSANSHQCYDSDTATAVAIPAGMP